MAWKYHYFEKPNSYQRPIYDTICNPTFHPCLSSLTKLPYYHYTVLLFSFSFIFSRDSINWVSFPSLRQFWLRLVAMRSIFRPLHLSSLMFVRFISRRSFLVTRPLVFLPSRPTFLPSASFAGYSLLFRNFLLLIQSFLTWEFHLHRPASARQTVARSCFPSSVALPPCLRCNSCNNYIIVL